MTGSLQIKNDKYYIVLNTYENGKRKRPWIATGLSAKGNKRRAEQMLRETLQEYEKKPKLLQCEMRFSDYIRSWMPLIRRKVDAITYQGYEVLANSQILPYFDASGIKLQKVTVDVLQKYIDEKAAHGRKDGKGGLSPRSLHLHKNILHQVLNEAVKNELLPNNPCQFVVLPKSDHFEAKFYTAQQLQELFDAVRDDPMYPMIKITALYGLRRSELLGLQWDSIDFERNLLTIRHTVSKVTVAVAKDRTKNASSYRSFPLTSEAREIFEKAKADEKENQRLFGKAYEKNNYVFKWDNGKPYSPDHVTRHFSRLLKNHNLPHIRFHELRHSCASLLLSNGFTLKDVQEWMGHADIKMTANIYGHLDVERKQGMAKQLSDTLFDAGRKTVEE